MMWMNVESLEIKSSKTRGGKKENEEHRCSTCCWNQQEVCIQELTIFQHPLAETHWSQCEAKLVCEVSTSQYCNVSERKQLEVPKLKHRFPRSGSTFLYRLTHRKHSMGIWIRTNCSHESTRTQVLYQSMIWITWLTVFYDFYSSQVFTSLNYVLYFLFCFLLF